MHDRHSLISTWCPTSRSFVGCHRILSDGLNETGITVVSAKDSPAERLLEHPPLGLRGIKNCPEVF